jgi:spermidine synthase
MLAAPALNVKLADKNQLKILVLGTGAGLLPMFLRWQLNSVLAEITTVDINPEVINVNHFSSSDLS